jgi:diguanylate cyclase (GGDEF)-like protein
LPPSLSINQKMRAKRRSTHSGGTRIFAIYAVASVLPLLLFVGVLLHTYRNEAVSRALTEGRGKASVIEEMAIAPALRGLHGIGDLSAARSNSLLAATELAIFSGDVLRLRVYGLDGRAQFSDDGAIASYTLSPNGGPFRRAALGATTAAIVPAPDGMRGQAIELFTPIIPTSVGQQIGVLELQLPYAPIKAAVAKQLQSAYVGLAVALAGLYLMLAGMAWATTHRLRRYAAERAHDALHDSLTGLPNRGQFRAHAERLTSSTGAGASGAICLVDLDGFKQINDRFGHQAGDELLKMVARRFTDSVRTDDFVSRLGGDEFGLVLPGVSSEDAAVAVLSELAVALSSEYVLTTGPASIASSIGVAFYPQHGTETDQLLACADIAMYEAKRSSRDVCIFANGAESAAAAHTAQDATGHQTPVVATESRS